jgi:hypothetical protein
LASAGYPALATDQVCDEEVSMMDAIAAMWELIIWSVGNQNPR